MKYAHILQEDPKMRLVIGKEGDPAVGSAAKLYFLIDEEDGVIADASFQAFGPLSLVYAMEALCDLAMRKNYDQASRIGADIVARHAEYDFQEEHYADLNMVIACLDNAVSKCEGIPFKREYANTPITDEGEASTYPNFEVLSKDQKLEVIEKIVELEIRPYIELDAGGITIHDLSDWEVFISYSGACTSCYAATGSTLSAVQNILKTRVHPDLIVTPLLMESSS